MPHDVTTCSLGNVRRMVEEWKPDTVVSAIHAPDLTPWPWPHIAHVKVPIEDIYNAEILAYKQAIRTVLALTGQRILFHCFHGMSRSTALAIALLYEDKIGGIEGFLEAHPEAEPNPLVLLLADEILEANGELLQACSERYKGRTL